MESHDRLTLERAQHIIAAALALPRTAPEKRIAVAVCDAGGHPIALAREDGAPPLLAEIAIAKAFTVVVYGRETGALGDVADAYPVWFGGISRVAQASMGRPLIGSKGGVGIRGADGRIHGAVGIAGETGQRDEEIARLAIEAAGPWM
jgi:uncharacterized protein GlcG (DUF336 family)